MPPGLLVETISKRLSVTEEALLKIVSQNLDLGYSNTLYTEYKATGRLPVRVYDYLLTLKE